MNENNKLTSGFPFTIDLPLYIPDLSIKFYMRPFTIDTGKSTFNFGYCRATLYLQYIPKRDKKPQYGTEEYSQLSYGIEEFELYKVKQAFANAANWFTPEVRKVIYGVNDQGDIIFNNECNGVNSMCTSETFRFKQVLKIVPAVLEDAFNHHTTGVILYINRNDNHILLDEDTLMKLNSFIQEFNFISYKNFMFNCMQYAESHNRIISQQEVQARYNNARQYDTNLY